MNQGVTVLFIDLHHHFSTTAAGGQNDFFIVHRNNFMNACYALLQHIQNRSVLSAGPNAATVINANARINFSVLGQQRCANITALGIMRSFRGFANAAAVAYNDAYCGIQAGETLPISVFRARCRGAELNCRRHALQACALPLSYLGTVRIKF